MRPFWFWVVFSLAVAFFFVALAATIDDFWENIAAQEAEETEDARVARICNPGCEGHSGYRDYFIKQSFRAKRVVLCQCQDRFEFHENR